MKLICILALLLQPVLTWALMINGTPVLSTEAPWVVKIERGPKFICSGSLISKKWVLTSAHCFKKTDLSQLSELKILGGGTGQAHELLAMPKIKRLVIHPWFMNFSTTPTEDAALVELEEEIVQSENLAPIELLEEKKLETAEISIYGWGFTDFDRKNLPKELLKIENRMITETELEEMKKDKNLKSFRPYFEPEFLVMNSSDSTTCNGDSGAGWVIYNDGVPKLAAIHSSGNCQKLAMGIFIGRHSKWIKKTISE